MASLEEQPGEPTVKFGSVVMSNASTWPPEIASEKELYRNSHLVLECYNFYSRCSGTENVGFQETSPQLGRTAGPPQPIPFLRHFLTEKG